MTPDFAGFTEPVPIERGYEQQAPAPAAADGVDTVLDRIHRAYHVELCDERESLLRGLETLRDSIEPSIRGPRGANRPPSRKAKRRVIAALDRFIAEGRGR